MTEWSATLSDKQMTEITDLARKRHAAKRKYKSSEVMSRDYWKVALMGEYHFGNTFDLEPDKSMRPQGDDGIDFIVGKTTIDVKSAQIPKYLIWKKSFKHDPADVLVLAGVNVKTNRVKLHGFYWGCLIKQEPYRNFGQADAYYKDARELQDEGWTMDRLLTWKQQMLIALHGDGK